MKEQGASGMLPASPFDPDVKWQDGDKLFIRAIQDDGHHLSWHEFYFNKFRHECSCEPITQKEIEDKLSELSKVSRTVYWEQQTDNRRLFYDE